VRYHTCHDGAHVGCERRAAVEAEPADPEEHCTEHDVCYVVRTVGEPRDVAIALALAKHDAVGQRCGSGGDVHGCPSSEVEAAHFEGPTGGIPGPAGDRVVDYGGPDKHEDDTWKHTAPVCCCTDGERGTVVLLVLILDPFPPYEVRSGERNREGNARNSREHALINRKQQIRDPRTAYTGSTQDIPKANVLQITDERVRRVREGQGVAPEEPLEGDDADGHAR